MGEQKPLSTHHTLAGCLEGEDGEWGGGGGERGGVG